MYIISSKNMLKKAQSEGYASLLSTFITLKLYR